MIKVLNIISDSNIGGAGNLLMYYLMSHNREKFTPSVAMPRGAMLKERIEPLGVRVLELDCLRDKSLDFKAIGELTRLIRSENPDIVHTHGALSGRIAAKRLKKPVVFTRHSAFMANPVFTKGLGRAFFKRVNEGLADRIIAVSPVCRDALVSGGVSDAIIDVIPNAAPPVKRLTEAERVSLRLKYGVAPEDFLVGIVARIEPYKGQMYVIEAARILKEQGRSFKLIIAGDGSQKGEAEASVNELGLDDTVIFTGFVSDTGGLMNILDVQVNASTVEATSLSLLEGMSIGLPAVASDESGNPYVIRDGVNGLLFKSRDGASLAEAIAKLQDSPSLTHALSAGATSVYEFDYSCARLAGSTEETYLKVLEGL